jgi:DNA-binding Lrp family transcriptional regulator
MVTAIVMIKTVVDRIPEIAQEVSALESVSEAYSVTGEWNLIAIVRVKAHEELAEVIPGRLNKIPGVVRTETHIAFRAYSSHDLEAAFSIGLE